MGRARKNTDHPPWRVARKIAAKSCPSKSCVQQNHFACNMHREQWNTNPETWITNQESGCAMHCATFARPGWCCLLADNVTLVSWFLVRESWNRNEGARLVANGGRITNCVLRPLAAPLMRLSSFACLYSILFQNEIWRKKLFTWSVKRVEKVDYSIILSLSDHARAWETRHAMNTKRTNSVISTDKDLKNLASLCGMTLRKLNGEYEVYNSGHRGEMSYFSDCREDIAETIRQNYLMRFCHASREEFSKLPNYESRGQFYREAIQELVRVYSHEWAEKLFEFWETHENQFPSDDDYEVCNQWLRIMRGDNSFSKSALIRRTRSRALFV